MAGALLIRPLCEGPEPEFAEPLGIERLAGYLRKHGVPAEIFDRRLYEAEHRAGLTGRKDPTFFDDVRAAFAKDDPPQLIGLSLMTAADLPDALRVASRLRAWYPQARLQAGGVFVTTNEAEARRRLPKGTVLVRGEGEAALLALMRGEPAPEGYLFPTAWPEPYRPDLVRYARLGCAVNVQGSRGCDGACTFCATPQLPVELRRHMHAQLGDTVAEITHAARRLSAAGLPPVFNFVDDDFGDLAHAEAFAGRLGTKGVRVAWACEMRLAKIARGWCLPKAEQVAALHEGGLTRVFFGVESLNAETLRAWQKPYDLRLLPRVLSAFREGGVSVQAGYILWHERQTLEGALAEVEQLRDLGIYTHQAAVSRLLLLPGSELGRKLRAGTPFALQRLGKREDAFYERFVAETAALRERWTAAAVREPYEAGRAFVTGEHAAHDALVAELAAVNEESYAAFVALAREFGASR